jgi:hypothetical protein
MTALLEHPRPDRRFAGLALTALVHVLLLFAWQATRRLPAPDTQRDTRRIQWIILPPPAQPERRAVTPEQAPERTIELTPERTPALAPALPRVTPAPAAPAITLIAPEAPASNGQAATPPTTAAASPATESGSLVQRSLHAAGSVARALRKENNPYIVAPPDSPQIRMRKGMEEAHALAPPALWEAPKIDELVNNTGDGARRTRVITGGGTYCITTRSPTSSIDTMETLGKERLTNCPAHESPASNQEWKTARDP